MVKIASIFRGGGKKNNVQAFFANCSTVAFSFVYSSTWKMEEISFSETSVDF
jgi:hypothetical protein